MSDIIRRPDAPLGRPTELSQEEAERLGETLKAGRSQNTKDTYAAAWKSWELWCAVHEHRPLPADPEVIALYVSDLVSAGRSLNTARMAVTAIGVAHKLAQAGRPDKDDRVRETLSALRRRFPESKAKPKHAVTVDILTRMLADLEPKSLRGARDRAILLLGFSGAFRRSELVGLNVEDLFWVEGGLAIKLTRSKTNQEGDTEWIRIGSDGSAIDPVVAVRHWLDKADLHVGPLFVGIHKSGSLHKKHLTPKLVAALVQKQARKVGLDPEEFGAHSLRAGFVTEAFAQDVSAANIMMVTRHKQFNQVLEYRRPPDPRDTGVKVIVRLGERK